VGADLIGAKAVEEIAGTLNTILDTPSKEVGNYIADKIRYLRYGSLLKIVKKAEEKAKNQGMLLKMPPLKFFVPFCENAALEVEKEGSADGTESLQELWQNLLISASSVATGESLYHLNILKNIGVEEAKFLNSLVRDGRADTFFMPLVSWDATDTKFLKEDSFTAAFTRLPENFEPEHLAEVVVRCAECSGILFEEVVFLTDEGELSADFSHERRGKRRIPTSVLRSLGVIEELDFHNVSVGRWDPTLRFFADGYRITTMGVRFFETCVGDLPQQNMAYDIDENSEGRTFSEIVRERGPVS
jgi:hypothetical protein